MSSDDKIFIDPHGDPYTLEEIRQRVAKKAEANKETPKGEAIVIVGPEGCTGCYIPHIMTVEECQAIGLVLVSLASSMTTSSGVEAVINALKDKNDALAKNEPVQTIRLDRNKLN